jgi:predicted amidophosphoribosyltransferase
LSGIEFFPEFMVARSKQKYKPDFTQIKPLPKNKRLILFDDIGTTYQTIYETLKTLRENPENNLENVSIPIFVAINNN